MGDSANIQKRRRRLRPTATNRAFGHAVEEGFGLRVHRVRAETGSHTALAIPLFGGMDIALESR